MLLLLWWAFKQKTALCAEHVKGCVGGERVASGTDWWDNEMWPRRSTVSNISRSVKAYQAAKHYTPFYNTMRQIRQVWKLSLKVILGLTSVPDDPALTQQRGIIRINERVGIVSVRMLSYKFIPAHSAETDKISPTNNTRSVVRSLI